MDDDDDGGLSWCELKAAEIGNLGSDNPMYAKASIWLMNNRNFQKYDTRNIGIVDELDLVEAMKVFLEVRAHCNDSVVKLNSLWCRITGNMTVSCGEQRRGGYNPIS